LFPKEVIILATIQSLLDDINLRYRNTFTTAQKVVWMNDEQNDLFEILEIDSVPYGFNTVASQFLYPIDAGIDIDRIKQLTIQVNSSTPPNFDDLPFKRTTDEVDVSECWYTLVERNFYINIPSGAVNNRAVYIYLDSQPTAISETNLSVEPSIPLRYQDIFKVGVLKRIASARKDTLMRNNLDAEYQEMIQDVQWLMKMNTPEFTTPIDVMPKVSRNITYRRTY
jgi:hypothetical protein